MMRRVLFFTDTL